MVKSAESLKFELNMQQLREIAGTAANRQAFEVQPPKPAELSALDKVTTKGIFAQHVTIDDEKVRERDKQAFKRNNPMAFKEIQKHNQIIHEKMVQAEQRKKQIRDMKQGIFK